MGSEFYRLDIGSPTAVVIDLTSQEFDPFLEIFATDSPGTTNAANVIGSDDDSGGSLNSRLSLTLDAGTYIIRVSTIAEPGAYTLTVSGDSTGGEPAGGGTAEVMAIGPGETRTGVLSSGAVNFFELTVTTDATIVIDLTSSEFDPTLDLYDTDNPDLAGSGNLLAFNDDHGLSLNSQITLALTPGTYLIGVSAFIAGSGAYELMVSEEAAGGGVPAEVISIVPGQTETGILSSGGVNFYALTLATDAALIIDLTSDDFDTFLELYDTGSPDEAGPTNLLAFNDDHGLSLNSQIMLSLTAGTYLIGVSAFSGSGTYVLQVIEDVPAVVNSISLGETATGLLSAGGAVDHYVFTLGQSTTVSIDLMSEEFDATLELHATDDPNAVDFLTFVAFNDDGGEGLNRDPGCAGGG